MDPECTKIANLCITMQPPPENLMQLSFNNEVQK